jgi:hypothetical protein
MNILTHKMEPMTWSPAEKKVARKAFELALGREFLTVMEKTKERAAKMRQPEDMWKLEEFLTGSRKRIDREYDYRHSVLLEVFANLIFKGRLREEELEGLRKDKLDLIQRYLELARKR